MVPVIAIVGRENVGKSTLFNALTASRAALVSDFPGMTRDRQYGTAEVEGHYFIVVDTGGLNEEQDILHQLTEVQAMQAISEADKIIFLVDGRQGPMAMDHSIAKQLRSLDKPIVLAVNKTEGLNTDIAITEFYALGLGAPLPIAAAHRQGMDCLAHALFQNDEAPSRDEQETATTGIKLALIGRPNVGKSTLANRLLGEDRVIVSDVPGTTRDSIFVPFSHQGQAYTLIDTAGIRQRGKIFEAVEKFSVVKTLQAISEAHVVLLMMDAHEGVTEQDLRLLGFVLESGRALVIAMNKWDGVDHAHRAHAESTIDRRLDFAPFVTVHFISALRGSGTSQLYSSVKAAYHSAMKKFSTPQLTKLLQNAVSEHEPPLAHGRRIKLRYAHPGGNNPPTFIIHGNQVHALPISYQRYLGNYFQKHLKLVGTPVRLHFKNSENPFRGRRKKSPSASKKPRKKTKK